MQVPKSTPCNLIEIRSPKWKDRAVGIAKYRVGSLNEIRILATDKTGKRYYPDNYVVKGNVVKSCKVQKLPSGIELYIVPISKLEILERI